MNGSTNHPLKHKIYIVRHGESAANVSQINLPPEEDVLTETGRCQADLLGKHLKDVVFTKAFASTYARAHDTAQFILNNSSMTKKPELKIDARIREREMGDFVNRPAKDLFIQLVSELKKGISFIKFEIPGAESVADFDGRIDSFIDDLYDELRASTEPETVLIVSHGLTIGRLMSKFKEWELSKGHSLESYTVKQACTPMTNTSYHVFTAQVPPKDCDDKICLHFLEYHNRCHLDSLREEGKEVNGVGHGVATMFAKVVELDPTLRESSCAIM